MEPFVKAAHQVYETFFDTYGIQLYREHVTLPGAAIRVAFQYLGDTKIYVPSEFSYKLMREKLVGGPSVLFNLLGLQGSKLKEKEFGAEARTLKSVFSLE